MTLSEATDLNTVLQWLLDAPAFCRELPSEEEARDALGRLADRAHSALRAGMDRGDVELHWRTAQPRRLNDRRQPT